MGSIEEDKSGEVPEKEEKEDDEKKSERVFSLSGILSDLCSL